MGDWEGVRLHVVTGKGGTGKTTVAGALAMALAAGGYAEPKAVDETWRIGTGAPAGPFQILDIVGLTTPYNILVNSGEDGQKLAAWLKSEYIDKGKLGLATGEGFYRYSSGDAEGADRT